VGKKKINTDVSGVPFLSTYGSSGSGKTTILRYLLKHHVKEKDKCLRFFVSYHKGSHSIDEEMDRDDPMVGFCWRLLLHFIKLLKPSTIDYLVLLNQIKKEIIDWHKITLQDTLALIYRHPCIKGKNIGKRIFIACDELLLLNKNEDFESENENNNNNNKKKKNVKGKNLVEEFLKKLALFYDNCHPVIENYDNNNDKKPWEYIDINN
jgi:energy-coupling factor transporter ATP-binding protein EcfA2